MNILALCGSLHANSANRSLLQLAVEVAPLGMHVHVDQLLGSLPLFNPDLEREHSHPSVDAFRSAVAAADALLIVCPEYGFSLPGVLKNGIDWLIGTGELETKLVATTALVPAPGRGQRGLDALHITLSAVSARVVGRTPIVGSPSARAGVQGDPGTRDALRQLLDSLLSEHRASRRGEVAD